LAEVKRYMQKSAGKIARLNSLSLSNLFATTYGAPQRGISLREIASPKNKPDLQNQALRVDIN